MLIHSIYISIVLANAFIIFLCTFSIYHMYCNDPIYILLLLFFSKCSLLLPAATKLGQGNKFTGVCLSTRGGGWGGEGVPGLIPGRGVWSEIFGGVSEFFFLFFPISFSPQKILLGCTPPPWDGQCAAGTHPTGMRSCFIINISNCKSPFHIFLGENVIFQIKFGNMKLC